MPGLNIGVPGLNDAEPIGSGGNAIVYRAFDPAHDRWVAVKILRGLGDETEHRRFDRERKAMGRLSEHEGIVTIHSSGFSETGAPYLLMSLLEKGSLQDLIDTNGPVQCAKAVKLMTTVAHTVHFAHEQDVIHRDLKPANIMLSASGYPLVADFGIAKQIGASASMQSTALTMTPAYSPPEIVHGAPATTAADVYALGATLYALLTAWPPFVTASDENLFAVLLRVANDPVRDLRPDGIPDDVCKVIESAMAKAPEDRPQSALEFAVALEASDLSTVPDTANPPAAPTIITPGPPAAPTVATPGTPSPPAAPTIATPGTPAAPTIATPGTPSPPAAPSIATPGTPATRSGGRSIALVGGLIVLALIAAATFFVMQSSSSTTDEPEAIATAGQDTPATAPATTANSPSAQFTDPDLVSEAPVGAAGAVMFWDDESLNAINADGSGEPVNLTLALDNLSIGFDAWIVPSRNGQWLAIETERFGCEDWSCLVVTPSNLSEVEVVRVAGELVHPVDSGAISDDGATVIFTSNGSLGENDLFVVQLEDFSWGDPVELTDASPHEFNERGRLTLDGSAVIFDCGPTQYGQAGTGICRVSIDGTGFEQLVSPEDGPDGTLTNLARSGDEAPDGSIVFEADWGNVERLWRLSEGELSPLSGMGNDNSPCVLSDGSIASLWYGREGNNDGLSEVKILSSDSTTYQMLVIDSDVIELHCSG